MKENDSLVISSLLGYTKRFDEIQRKKVSFVYKMLEWNICMMLVTAGGAGQGRGLLASRNQSVLPGEIKTLPGKQMNIQ